MVEKILEKIVNEMAVHLDQGQLEHLSNVLYVNFHGLEVQEQCTELVSSGMEIDIQDIAQMLQLSLIDRKSTRLNSSHA